MSPLPSLLLALLALLSCAALPLTRADTAVAAPAAASLAAASPAPAPEPEPCAADFTHCGAHPGAFPDSFHAAVCCPTATTRCQRTARSFRCIAKEEADACDTCCNGGSCAYDAGKQGADSTGGVMRPAVQLMCCGKSALDGSSFCCPTHVPAPAPAQGHLDAHAAAQAEGGRMRPAPVLHAQQCRASPHAWSCVDHPPSLFQHVSVGGLALWELILCVVAGVLFCGVCTGGAHRAHGGHCSNDCEACTAFLGGCFLFELCFKGGKGPGAPLLG